MANTFDYSVSAAIRHCVVPSSIHNLSGLDRLAELLSQGLDTNAIAEICQYQNRQVANSQIQRLRKQLGRQAV